MSIARMGVIERRHKRLRKKLSGTAARPRLCIHKSLRHLYAQLVDDDNCKTITAVTTNRKSNRDEGENFSNAAWAKKLGTEIARVAQEKGIKAVVFDRGGYQYHGVVKTFADAAREGGLKF